MKIFLITIGVFFSSILAFIVYVFCNMPFIADITERKVKKAKTHHLLAEGIQVSELEHQMPPLEYEYRPGTGAMPPAAEALLSPENTISESERFYDSDPNISVLWLKAAGDLPDKIFLKKDVYGIGKADANANAAEGDDGKDEIIERPLGEKLASFDNPAGCTTPYRRVEPSVFSADWRSP